MSVKHGIGKLGILLALLAVILCIVYLGNYLMWLYGNEHVERGLGIEIANLNMVVNVGEPIYIKALNFTSIWPGERGNLTIKLVNLAPISYTVHFVCSGVISPNKDAVPLSFDRKTVVVDGGSETEVTVPFYVKSSAPIGVYELSIKVYRGVNIDNALLISELHLVGYVGGEPIQVVAIELPTLWPGSNGYFTIKLRNIADIPYNISISISEIKGPNDHATIKISPINSVMINSNSFKTLRMGFYISDNAATGTYVISVIVKRV